MAVIRPARERVRFLQFSEEVQEARKLVRELIGTETEVEPCALLRGEDQLEAQSATYRRSIVACAGTGCRPCKSVLHKAGAEYAKSEWLWSDPTPQWVESWIEELTEGMDEVEEVTAIVHLPKATLVVLRKPAWYSRAWSWFREHVC